MFLLLVWGEVDALGDLSVLEFGDGFLEGEFRDVVFGSEGGSVLDLLQGVFHEGRESVGGERGFWFGELGASRVGATKLAVH